jgi:hypothetical protein
VTRESSQSRDLDNRKIRAGAGFDSLVTITVIPVKISDDSARLAKELNSNLSEFT